MRELQEWMYGAITSTQWPEDTSRVVDASRLAIYRDMYPIRMHEAMAVDYPAMTKFLGEHDFNHLEKMDGHQGWEWIEGFKAVTDKIVQPTLTACYGVTRLRGTHILKSRKSRHG